jgi:uncharacterized protein (DUF433 family)
MTIPAEGWRSVAKWRWVEGDSGMSRQYVEQRDGGYWIVGTRVSLDSVVYAFLEGQTAENIAQSFPVLTLEQVYGALAFYLADRADVDAYLAAARADFEAKRQAARDRDPMFYKKLADFRRQMEAAQP